MHGQAEAEPSGRRDNAAAGRVMEETTEGTLLGGRLSYRQFRHGYRTGIEPVLLAASVPAAAGQRVLEAGCGAGAGLLCLCARVGGLDAGGIEFDAATASLAVHNWRANGFGAIALHQVRLPDLPPGLGRFDHVLANPPWHRAAASASPLLRRDLARRAPAGLLEDWIGALATVLAPGATLTLALPAALHARASAAFCAAGLGGVVLLPLWPKPGLAAKLVLMQARHGSKADAAVLPGLVLHQDGGRYTDAAEAILRRGDCLRLGV